MQKFLNVHLNPFLIKSSFFSYYRFSKIIEAIKKHLFLLFLVKHSAIQY